MRRLIVITLASLTAHGGVAGAVRAIKGPAGRTRITFFGHPGADLVLTNPNPFDIRVSG